MSAKASPEDPSAKSRTNEDDDTRDPYSFYNLLSEQEANANLSAKDREEFNDPDFDLLKRSHIWNDLKASVAERRSLYKERVKLRDEAKSTEPDDHKTDHNENDNVPSQSPNSADTDTQNIPPRGTPSDDDTNVEAEDIHQPFAMGTEATNIAPTSLTSEPMIMADHDEMDEIDVDNDRSRDTKSHSATPSRHSIDAMDREIPTYETMPELGAKYMTPFDRDYDDDDIADSNGINGTGNEVDDVWSHWNGPFQDESPKEPTQQSATDGSAAVDEELSNGKVRKSQVFADPFHWDTEDETNNDIQTMVDPDHIDDVEHGPGVPTESGDAINLQVDLLGIDANQPFQDPFHASPHTKPLSDISPAEEQYTSPLDVNDNHLNIDSNDNDGAEKQHEDLLRLLFGVESGDTNGAGNEMEKDNDGGAARISFANPFHPHNAIDGIEPNDVAALSGVSEVFGVSAESTDGMESGNKSNSEHKEHGIHSQDINELNDLNDFNNLSLNDVDPTLEHQHEEDTYEAVNPLKLGDLAPLSMDSEPVNLSPLIQNPMWSRHDSNISILSRSTQSGSSPHADTPRRTTTPKLKHQLTPLPSAAKRTLSGRSLVSHHTTHSSDLPFSTSVFEESEEEPDDAPTAPSSELLDNLEIEPQPKVPDNASTGVSEEKSFPITDGTDAVVSKPSADSSHSPMEPEPESSAAAVPIAPTAPNPPRKVSKKDSLSFSWTPEENDEFFGVIKEATPPPLKVMNEELSDQLTTLLSDTMRKHQAFWMVDGPDWEKWKCVDWPDHIKDVECHTLNQVKAKLESGAFQTPGQFAESVRGVFRCYTTYHWKGAAQYRVDTRANILWEEFNDEYFQVLADESEERKQKEAMQKAIDEAQRAHDYEEQEFSKTHTSCSDEEEQEEDGDNGGHREDADDESDGDENGRNSGGSKGGDDGDILEGSSVATTMDDEIREMSRKLSEMSQRMNSRPHTPGPREDDDDLPPPFEPALQTLVSQRELMDDMNILPDLERARSQTSAKKSISSAPRGSMSTNSRHVRFQSADQALRALAISTVLQSRCDSRRGSLASQSSISSLFGRKKSRPRSNRETKKAGLLGMVSNNVPFGFDPTKRRGSIIRTPAPNPKVEDPVAPVFPDTATGQKRRTSMERISSFSPRSTVNANGAEPEKFPYIDADHLEPATEADEGYESDLLDAHGSNTRHYLWMITILCLVSLLYTLRYRLFADQSDPFLYPIENVTAKVLTAFTEPLSIMALIGVIINIQWQFKVEWIWRNLRLFCFIFVFITLLNIVRMVFANCSTLFVYNATIYVVVSSAMILPFFYGSKWKESRTSSLLLLVIFWILVVLTDFVSIVIHQYDVVFLFFMFYLAIFLWLFQLCCGPVIGVFDSIGNLPPMSDVSCLSLLVPALILCSILASAVIIDLVISTVSTAGIYGFYILMKVTFWTVRALWESTALRAIDGVKYMPLMFPVFCIEEFVDAVILMHLPFTPQITGMLMLMAIHHILRDSDVAYSAVYKRFVVPLLERLVHGHYHRKRMKDVREVRRKRQHLPSISHTTPRLGPHKGRMVPPPPHTLDDLTMHKSHQPSHHQSVHPRWSSGTGTVTGTTPEMELTPPQVNEQQFVALDMTPLPMANKGKNVNLGTEREDTHLARMILHFKMHIFAEFVSRIFVVALLLIDICGDALEIGSTLMSGSGDRRRGWLILISVLSILEIAVSRLVSQRLLSRQTLQTPQFLEHLAILEESGLALSHEERLFAHLYVIFGEESYLFRRFWIFFALILVYQSSVVLKALFTSESGLISLCDNFF